MTGREVLWFVAGFFTRAMIAYASDVTWQWRIARAMHRNRRPNGEDNDMRWQVTIRGIEWDDGKGEYDVSDLPDEWTATVIAENSQEAIQYALTDADESNGSLILGYDTVEIQQMSGPRKRQH